MKKLEQISVAVLIILLSYLFYANYIIYKEAVISTKENNEYRKVMKPSDSVYIRTDNWQRGVIDSVNGNTAVIRIVVKKDNVNKE